MTSAALRTCWYCGKDKPLSEFNTGEHIVPACIGGNRNGTYVDSVCDTCNAYMSKNAEIPFCRDFFIDGERLKHGITHSGNVPSAHFGHINWKRPEQVEVYLLEKGENIFHFRKTRDGQDRVAVLADPAMPPDMAERLKKFIKERFRKTPCINCKNHTRTSYDDELLGAIAGLAGGSIPISKAVNTNALDIEVVKIVLGLSCLALGEDFVKSPQATLLRTFIFEPNPDERAKIPLRGHIASSFNPGEKRVLDFLRPTMPIHHFVILDNKQELACIVRIFDKYESVVVVDSDRTFAGKLPGSDDSRGVCWVVDPWAKTTLGPLEWRKYMAEQIMKREHPDEK